MQFLRVSGMCALLIAVIWLLRLVLRRRLPAGCFTALWLAAAVRLMLPISLPSRLSIYNLLPQAGTRTVSLSSALPVQAAIPQAVSPVLIAWCAGAGLMLAYLLLSWQHLTHSYRDAQAVDNQTVRRALDAVPLRRRVRVCVHARAATPFTYGVLRPVIVLPSALVDMDETLRFVLLHELCHIRRWDCLRKLFFALTRCVHWFNPLVWLMCRAADADLEHACDAAVLRLGGDCRRAYAAALLQMAEAPAPGLGSAFQKTSAVEERIVTIMTFKKRSMIGLAMSAAVFAATTSAFAADAQPQTSLATLTTPLAAAVQPAEVVPAGLVSAQPEGGATIPVVTYSVSEKGNLSADVGDVQFDENGNAVVYAENGNVMMAIQLHVDSGISGTDSVPYFTVTGQ